MYKARLAESHMILLQGKFRGNGVHTIKTCGICMQEIRQLSKSQCFQPSCEVSDLLLSFVFICKDIQLVTDDLSCQEGLV